MKKKYNISAVILAAGLSERMGKPKFLLQLNNHTFVEMLIEQYQKFGCEEVVIVINCKDKELFDLSEIKDKNVKVIVNDHPEWGRFHSLQLGLSLINKNNSTFISNIDNPFADTFLLKKMMLISAHDNYVVPVYKEKKGHPILIGNFIVKMILSEPTSDLNFKLYLRRFTGLNTFSNSDKILININNSEDYQNLMENYI